MKKLKSIVQRFLSIPLIKKITDKIAVILLTIITSHRIFVILYYNLDFITFSREQHAVLKGRLNYIKNKKKSKRNKVELRRNIHRIEKGLLMKPRRDVFAENYILFTVKTFKNAVNELNKNNSLDKNELNWAYDVLKKYFSVVDDKPKNINEAKHIFNKIDYDSSGKEAEDMSPYLRGHQKSPIEYEDLLKLSKQRRSIRWFEDKKVPRGLLDKALKVGRQSPSACNRLPFEYRFYDDPDLVKEIADIPFGASGYSHNIPTIAVLVGKLDNYFSPRDRHIIYIDSSLSAMSFMFALETLGLASSVINWPDFELLEIKMQKKLNLDTDERPIMLIAIGYPDPKGGIAYSQKKSLDSIRSYNRIK